MNSHVESAIDEELVQRDVRVALRRVAVGMVSSGLGAVVRDPLREQYDYVLRSYRDRTERESPAAAGAFNRARYALHNFADLGPDVLARAVADLWREGGGTCARAGTPEAAVEGLMVGAGAGGKQRAGRLLAVGCGTLAPAGGPVALHSFGQVSAVLRRLGPTHEYRPVEAKLARVDFSDLDLRGVRLVAADLTDANLFNADLREADLRRANAYKAKFKEVDASDADFTDASLFRTDFYRANLRGAVLRDTDLGGADFKDSQLNGADLRGATLPIGVKFNGADLTGALRDEGEDRIPGWVVRDGALVRE